MLVREQLRHLPAGNRKFLVPVPESSGSLREIFLVAYGKFLVPSWQIILLAPPWGPQRFGLTKPYEARSQRVLSATCGFPPALREPDKNTRQNVVEQLHWRPEELYYVKTPIILRLLLPALSPRSSMTTTGGGS